MFRPAYLQKGDTVALTCPARSISLEEIQNAITVLQSWGLQVEIGKTVGNSYHQFSDTDSRRAKDFQQYLDNPSIKAIIACRGGYGTVRIMDELRYDRFLSYPKWIVGYSDISILHIHLNCTMGISSLHGSMPINFGTNSLEALESLKKGLFGEPLIYEFPSHPLNIKGEMSGEMIGGNLSLIYSVLGTKTIFNTNDKIIFIEDLDEYLYHIDRMTTSLVRAGKFQGIKGILVGALSDMKDNTIPFGKNAEEIIYEHTKKLGIPIAFGFPAGHIADNRALRLGQHTTITVGESFCCFEQ